MYVMFLRGCIVYEAKKLNLEISSEERLRV